MRIITANKFPKNIFRFRLLALFVFILIFEINPGGVFADHSDRIRFHHSMRIGNVITGAIQDNDGFLWISGRGGLRRYDGYEIKLYQKSSHNISDNWTTSVLEDHSGIIWAGTRTGGLNRYSKDTDSFSVFQHDKSDTDNISDNNITCLYEDSQKNLWVGTQNKGLNRLNPETNSFTHYTHNPANLFSLNSSQILTIKEDELIDGILWIGTIKGLNRLEISKGRINRYPENPESPDYQELAKKGISAIEIDNYGNLWLGTLGNGLFKYERSTNTFCHYMHEPENEKSLAGDVITDLFFDSTHNLWISHFHKGISLYDPHEDNFTIFKADTDNQFALRSNDVAEIMEDRSNNIWVFCTSGEIEKFDSKSKGFVHYRHETGKPGTLSSNVILPIIEDHDKNIWLATGNGGLNRFNRELETFTAYKPITGDPASLKHLTVLGLHEDSLGNFWVGTTDLIDTALSLFDKTKGRVIKHYVHDPQDPYSIGKGSMVREILQDNKDPYALWVSIDEFGLDKMDIKTGKFNHDYALKAANKGINPEFRIWDLYQDNNHILWLATEGAGLARLDTETKEYLFYRHQPDNDKSIASDTVFTLYHDKNGILWVGTDNGLERFDPKTEIFTHFTTDQGLSDNSVYGIIGHKSGYLWISTNRGLCRFDPQTNTFRVYTMSDGLQADAFFNRAFGQTGDGEMWFGGLNGVNRFKPEDIGDNHHIPHIVITALTQGGEPLQLNRDTSRIKSVSLSWQHNYFEFEYAALEFTQPEKNRYKYKLHGMDRHWFDAGTRRFGRYTGIPAGEYILQIIASNNDGLWNKTGTSLKIKVIPPFWRTSWFFLLIILISILLASIIFLYIIRMKREISLRKKAEESVRKELELRKKMEKDRKNLELKLHRAQRMEALGTLAGGIAHDFNNLLMGIQGRASLMQFHLKADHPNANHIREIESYVRTAADLTGQLLGFARGGKYEVKTIDINQFIKETSAMFGRTRKQISMIFNLQEDTWTIDADASQLHQVLLNLFVNASQAMPEGGEIFIAASNTILETGDVSAYHLEPGQYVKISVSDTGIGIDKNIINRIFDPFFTTKEQGRGTGLGLASAYGIIRNHEGFITVYSEKGSGTTFNIYLPASDKTATKDQKTGKELISGTESILLIDDEPMILEVGSQMLTHLGYKVKSAASGKQAVKYYRSEKEKISLVILDMIMPELDGGQTFEKLKKINPDVRVILSSGYSLNGQAVKIMEKGCCGFIQKPFNIYQLSRKIREVLD